MQKTDVILRKSPRQVNVIKIIANKISSFLYILGLILLAVIFIVLIVLFVLDPYWLSVDSCLDNGKVWDYEKNVCREDCLIWQEEFGCIKLTEKQIQIFEKCGSSNLCPSWKTYKDVCLNNQKAWNLKSQECKYNFVPTECFKLQGEWHYPERCYDKGGK